MKRPRSRSLQTRRAKTCIDTILGCVQIPHKPEAREGFIDDLVRVLHKGGHSLCIRRLDVSKWITEYEAQQSNFKYCPGKKIGRRFGPQQQATSRQASRVTFREPCLE